MLDGLRQKDIREDKTGIKIFNQLRDMNEFGSEKKIFCSRDVVETVDALRDRLNALADELPADFAYILHLECHGGDDFIEIGDGREQMTWREFMKLLAPLNLRNECNVGLVLACCNGFGSFKVDDLAEPVPFYFQLSHSGVIYSNVLEESLTEFYRKILTEQDLHGAVSAAAPFKMKYAEEMFANLIYRVMHSESRKKSYETDVNTILSGVLSKGGIGGNMDISFNRKLVKDHVGTFEKQIADRIRSHMGFFSGRKPGFTLEQLVAWVAGGKTLK